jgi:hypothetical protein
MNSSSRNMFGSGSRSVISPGAASSLSRCLAELQFISAPPELDQVFGLDLGEVENVVDQREQVTRRAEHAHPAAAVRHRRRKPATAAAPGPGAFSLRLRHGWWIRVIWTAQPNNSSAPREQGMRGVEVLRGSPPATYVRMPSCTTSSRTEASTSDAQSNQVDRGSDCSVS